MPPLSAVGSDTALITACKNSWDEVWGETGSKNADNCSGFAKAVAQKMGAMLPDKKADGLIDFMSENWAKVKSGADARAKAAAGRLVICGLRSDEQKSLPVDGHVAIVVDGPLYHGKYPMCWCGSNSHFQSQGTLSVGQVFNVADRDDVKYYTPDSPVTS